jgi:hypothetical protein
VVVGSVLRHVGDGGGVTWLVRLIAGVVVLAGQASFGPNQVTDEDYGPDSRGEFLVEVEPNHATDYVYGPDSRGQFTVEPRSGPPGTTITFTVRCTTGPNLTGTPAAGVSLHFGKAYDTTYDRSLNRPLDQAGSGVFTIVVPEGVPPTRVVNGGETDIAYGVGGGCFLDDMSFASFRRNFVVTVASVSPVVATTVDTSLPSARIVTGLPTTGGRLAIPLTAGTLLLIGVGLALRRAQRRRS